MGFVTFLKALDELLYEVMSWLVFYPITLWKVIRHPAAMMNYADAELNDAKSEQYSDTLNPPVFLLVTLLIAHAAELEFIGESPLVTSHSGLAGLISDDTSLILFRLAAFSVFPVVMGAWLVRRQRVGLNRQTLEAPFYAQCYPTALFALVISIASSFAHVRWDGAAPAAFAMQLVALLWYLTVQTGWFARHLGVPRWRALIDAVMGFVGCFLLLAVMVVLFGGYADK